MTQTYSSHRDEFLFRLSEAAEEHPREEGCFEVRYNQFAKSFTSLASAFFYYLRLDVAATLWDVTDSHCLIERKIILLGGETAEPSF